MPAWTPFALHLVFYFIAASFCLGVLAVPAPTLVDQVALGKGGRRYENGELPPMKNTVGWTDPRLNGGRFLDVSSFPVMRYVVEIYLFGP